MGTSTDRAAGAGGSWTPLKHAATSYLRGLSAGSPNTRTFARRLASRHVPVLGGAAAAAAGARAGRTGTQRLGALLAGIGARGLEGALDALGLAELVGRDRFDVLDELITFIAGDGDDLDAQAARDAACDVIDEVFSDADTWQDLSQVSEETVSREGMSRLLETFIAQYIYNRIPVIAERLSRLTDPHAARRADQEIKQVVQDMVAMRLPDDPVSVDWAGPQGRSIIDDAFRLTYEALEVLEALDGDAL